MLHLYLRLGGGVAGGRGSRDRWYTVMMSYGFRLLCRSVVRLYVIIYDVCVHVSGYLVFSVKVRRRIKSIFNLMLADYFQVQNKTYKTSQPIYRNNK